MSARGEVALVQHLFDVDSLRVLAEEGLHPDVIPTEIVRSMVAWALDYWHRSGRSAAPSIEAFRAIEVGHQSYGDSVDDLGIDIAVEADDTIEWVISDLRATWATKQVQDFAKDLVTKMAGAHTDDRVNVVDEFANRLVQVSMRLTDRSAATRIEDGIVDRLYEYERRAAAEESLGAHFGLDELDEYTHGIQPGELAVLAAPPKAGKAQPLDSMVLTPFGWRCMGDVAVGDVVCGQGGATKVLAVHPQGVVPIYRVTMSDGASVEVCGDHLWEVKSHGNTRSRVLTTLEAREILLGGGKRKLYIPMADPVEFAAGTELPVDPYLLGVLIGDGGMSQNTVVLTTADQQIVDEVVQLLPSGVTAKQRGRYGWGLVVERGVRINPLGAALRSLGLMPGRSHTRFIPSSYLFASVADRMSLLQGLLDTDGSVEGRRSVTYCTTSPMLASDVRELVEGLGGVCRIAEKQTSHRLAFILRMRLPLSLGCPFRLGRKEERWRPPTTKARGPRRMITAVDYVGMKEAQCITVDADDHLYLTEHAIVTHNSYLTAKIALAERQRGRKVALFTLENNIGMTIDRMACMAAGVDSSRWQRGECTPEELAAVFEWAAVIQADGQSLWVLQPDLGKRSMEQMVREAQIRGADTLIIDQLTFVELPSPKKARHERIGEALHSLKGMISTGRGRMPCFLAHQVNREGVKAADKAGHLEMYHMAESAEVERTADWVFGLYASPDEKIAQQLKFQTLAARRAVPRHWQLNWQIGMGHISVRQPLEIHG